LLAGTIAVPAQTFATLHSFDGSDGEFPFAALIQGTNGILFGTTNEGAGSSGGTAFQITTGGVLTTLYSFCSQIDCADGEHPSTLIQATDANFYGTTCCGGANGHGTVFRINPVRELTVLYSFCAQSGCTDGNGPLTALVQGSDGNLYGTAASGGELGWGTAFKITLSGRLTTLHSFAFTEGSGPSTPLIQAADGNFYGTAAGGGAFGNMGTVYMITPAGSLTTLHSFNGTDGNTPNRLVRGRDGNFYGTTNSGGANIHYGTVFKITSRGTLTTLYSFCSQSNCADGEFPRDLNSATDGAFYGTTVGGGSNGGLGTIFKIDSSAALTTLYNFCSQSGCADGSNPHGALVQGTDGKFYGTTENGGTNRRGTVFSLSAGLKPFVEVEPASGKTGQRVKILGTNLKGASSLTFNGTPATFEVISGSLISTTVPPGATTGPVQVVTPSGTLTSNVNFQVLP